MKSLNDQLENYLMFKNKYDKFYRKYITFAKEVNIEQVISTYLQSNIRHKFLQQGFKGREAEKILKVK